MHHLVQACCIDVNEEEDSNTNSTIGLDRDTIERTSAAMYSLYLRLKEIQLGGAGGSSGGL